MANNNLIYDVRDVPKPFGKLLVFAFQQVLAIMAATIAVPTIVGRPTDIPAAILGAGLGTIVYLLFTRFKSPVFLGSSFAFLSSLGVAVAYGYFGIIIGSVFAGLVYVILAIIIHFAGTKWVSKLMPPVIIGPTVALIGLSLAGSAMGDIVKANGAVTIAQQLVETAEGSGTWVMKEVTTPTMGYNLIALLCGLVTFITIIVCSSQKKFKTPKLIPFIIGIGVGYLVAAFFSAIGYGANVNYLKIIDWSPLVNNFKVLAANSGATAGQKVQAFLTYPNFALLHGITDAVNGNSGLTASGVAEVAIAFIPVALVVFAEHIADHKNLGSIIGKDLVEGEPGLKRTLLGDGVGSIVGTVFGFCPNTTYGESVGCVAITKNASVWTILTAAIMCIVLSFISPIMCLLQTIPSCVMGGVCLTLYGFIAVSGLKMFKNIDLGENRNLFVVSAILIAGIGGLAIQIPYAVDGNGMVAKTIQVTSIATALILGIVTNAIITAIEKRKGGEDEKPESLMAAPVGADATYEVGESTGEEDVVKTETVAEEVVLEPVETEIETEETEVEKAVEGDAIETVTTDTAE